MLEAVFSKLSIFRICTEEVPRTMSTAPGGLLASQSGGNEDEDEDDWGQDINEEDEEGEWKDRLRDYATIIA